MADVAALAFTQGLLPGLNATLNVISGGKGSLEGLIEIGHGIGRAMALAASAAYGLASGWARVLELQAITPSWTKKLNDYAEDFDKRSRDAMYFAVHGKEATSAPEDPLATPHVPTGKPLALVNSQGAEKAEAAAKERDAALAKLAEQRAQTQFQAVKAAGEARLAELESQHSRELISDGEFYARKLAIQREELDAELKAATTKQAAVDVNIAELTKNARRHGGHFDVNLSAGEITVARGHQGDPEAVSDESKIAELLSRRLQITSEINQISANTRKLEAEAATQADATAKKMLQLADELAAKREESLGGSVAARQKQLLDQGEDQRQALTLNLEYANATGNLDEILAAKKALDDATANRQHDLSHLSAKGADEQYGLRSTGLQAQRSEVDHALARGTITSIEGLREKIALDQEEARALQPVLTAYENLADLGDLQATQKVIELKQRISELETPIDDVATHMRETLDGAFEGLFENLDQGTKALESFAASIKKTLEEATYKRFLEPFVQMELGKLIPNGSQTPQHPPAYGDAGIGGVHAVPATSMSGAVKAVESIGSVFGVPRLSGLDKRAAGTITIVLENESGLPLKVGDIKPGGNLDRSQVEAVLKESFEDGGFMRQILTGFHV